MSAVRGCPVPSRAKIVTSRFGLRESWTLPSYLDNGGYQGLRRLWR